MIVAVSRVPQVSVRVQISTVVLLGSIIFLFHKLVKIAIVNVKYA